jgi:hypothetical protein
MLQEVLPASSLYVHRVLTLCVAPRVHTRIKHGVPRVSRFSRVRIGSRESILVMLSGCYVMQHNGASNRCVMLSRCCVMLSQLCDVMLSRCYVML